MAQETKPEPIVPLVLADSLYAQMAYGPASVEYKRHLFLSEDQENRGRILYRLGSCLQYMGRFHKADSALKSALVYETRGLLHDQIRLRRAVGFLAGSHLATAEAALIRLVTFSDYDDVRRRARVLLGISYAYQFKWEEVEKLLSPVMAQASPALADTIRSTVSGFQSEPGKSPSKARWLSTFVPGLGQLYGGHPLRALNSLGLNAATGYLFVNIAKSSLDPIELFIYFVTFFRYWDGGRDRAEEYVRKDIEEMNTDRRRGLLDLIERLSLSVP